MSPLFKDYNTRTDCLSLHQVMNPVVSLHLVYEVTLLLLLVYVVWVGGEEAGIKRIEGRREGKREDRGCGEEETEGTFTKVR